MVPLEPSVVGIMQNYWGYILPNTVKVPAKVNMSINKILKSVQLTMKPEI